MHNCEVDCSKMAGEVGIPVINDVLYAKQAKKAVKQIYGGIGGTGCISTMVCFGKLWKILAGISRGVGSPRN